MPLFCSRYRRASPARPPCTETISRRLG